VVGAGNKEKDQIAFPACLESTISVVATEGPDERWFWSNWSGSADLAAPGGAIQVPRPGAPLPLDLGPGTSIAAPVVAGAIALLRQSHPHCDMQTILAALRASPKRVPAVPTPAVPALPFVQIEAARKYLDQHCPALSAPSQTRVVPKAPIEAGEKGSAPDGGARS